MNVLALVVAVCVVVYLKYLYEEVRLGGLSLFAAVFPLIPSLICGLFAALLMGWVGDSFADKQTTDFSYSISSMSHGQGISGSFVLGSGNVQDRTYYIVMRKTSDGHVKTRFEDKGVVISESNNETPRVEGVQTCYTDTAWNRFFMVQVNACLQHDVKRVVVPVGTVVREFVAN